MPWALSPSLTPGDPDTLRDLVWCRLCDVSMKPALLSASTGASTAARVLTAVGRFSTAHPGVGSRLHWRRSDGPGLPVAG